MKKDILITETTKNNSLTYNVVIGRNVFKAIHVDDVNAVSAYVEQSLPNNT